MGFRVWGFGLFWFRGFGVHASGNPNGFGSQSLQNRKLGPKGASTLGKMPLNFRPAKVDEIYVPQAGSTPHDVSLKP